MVSWRTAPRSWWAAEVTAGVGCSVSAQASEQPVGVHADDHHDEVAVVSRAAPNEMAACSSNPARSSGTTAAGRTGSVAARRHRTGRPSDRWPPGATGTGRSSSARGARCGGGVARSVQYRSMGSTSHRMVAYRFHVDTTGHHRAAVAKGAALASYPLRFRMRSVVSARNVFATP